MEEEFGSQQDGAIIKSNDVMAPRNIQTQVETNELAEDGAEDKPRAQDSASGVNQDEAAEDRQPTNGAPKEETEDQTPKVEDLASTDGAEDKPRAQDSAPGVNQDETAEDRQPTNGAPKEETEDQAPKVEDLALNVATGRQGRRPRHQRGNRTEGMAKKAAEFGIRNQISEPTTANQADKVEGGMVDKTENEKPSQGPNDSKIQQTARPSPESSISREPSQFMTTAIAAQAPPPPHLPALPPIDLSHNNVAGSSDPKAELRLKAGPCSGSVSLQPNTRPGAVQAMGRAFGDLPAWQTQNPQPTTGPPAPPLFAITDSMLTANVVDEEAVVYAEEVQLDNRSRNKRLVISCILIALVAVVVAVVVVTVAIDDQDDPRCLQDHDVTTIDVHCECNRCGCNRFENKSLVSLEIKSCLPENQAFLEIPDCLKTFGEIGVAVHCKCFNTTEFYTPLLTEAEWIYYNRVKDESLEMSSCSPQNQALLEKIDPRCLKDDGEINIVRHCNCFKTTKHYTPTLNEDELIFYNQIKNESLEITSCSPHNQVLLEIASVNRKRLNTSTIEIFNELSFKPSFTELYGIILFYILMDGDNWENQDNWLKSYNYCRFFGVECTSLGRITGIILPRNGLAGTLPTETSSIMRNLFVLDLSQNKGIYGILPAEIIEIATKLHVLNLDSVGLSGTIPENVARLQRLNRLILRNNSFNGTLPSWLGEMKLASLHLGGNQFTGPIPTELGKQTSLQSLILYRNMLTGTLPAELGNMTSLELLDISNNMFRGTLPSFLGTLPGLDTTLINKSGFTGPIPDTFCNRTGRGDLADSAIQANCGNKNDEETKKYDVIIPSCACCNRTIRSLIWCFEDGLGSLFEDKHN